MNSYFFTISSSWLLLTLFCLMALAFSYYSYRNTVPPISKSKKAILVGLRTLALCLLIFVLFEPVYTIINTFELEPQIAVLLDDSQSLSADDAAGNRTNRYKELLKNIHFSDINGKVRFYKFSNDIKNIDNFSPDSLRLDGQLTDISYAIKTVNHLAGENNIQAMLLISDGAFNAGNNPIFDAENFAKPIYTIGIGDTSEPKDIAVISLLTNEIAYIDNPIPVNINFKAIGYNGEIVKLTLLDNGQKISEQEFKIFPERENYTAIFEYNPAVEGVRKITATLSKLDGEITDKNNSYSEFVKILKNKRSVAIFAGSPSPDFAFIKRVLKAEKGVEIMEFVQKQGSNFYVQPTPQLLASADMFIFCGFPINSTPQNIIDMVNLEINKGKSLFFIAGLTTDYGKLKQMQDNMPFVLVSSKQQELMVSPNINVESLANPLLKITGTDKDIELWNNMPPLFRTETFVRVKPESEIVSTMKMNNISLKDPLIITRDFQNKKSVAIMGYGLYRWKLLGYANDISKGRTDVPDIFEILVNNAFRWLSVREKDKQVNIRTTKKHYNQTEKVEFIGEIYDAAFVPVENADVNVEIGSGENKRTITLNSIGNGRYYAGVEGLSKGDFPFTAKASLSSRNLGADNGRFSVGELAIEYQNLKQNAALLKLIADRTNGKFYSSNNISSLIEDISSNSGFVPRMVTKRNEFYLWNWVWILSAAIACFSIEWIIRKRTGLL